MLQGGGDKIVRVVLGDNPAHCQNALHCKHRRCIGKKGIPQYGNENWCVKDRRTEYFKIHTEYMSIKANQSIHLSPAEAGKLPEFEEYYKNSQERG